MCRQYDMIQLGDGEAGNNIRCVCLTHQLSCIHPMNFNWSI